jgi:hypothetical protein
MWFWSLFVFILLHGQYRSPIFSTLPFAKFNENEQHGIGHFVVANPTSKIKIFELLDHLIWDLQKKKSSLTYEGFILEYPSMKEGCLFVLFCLYLWDPPNQGGWRLFLFKCFQRTRTILDFDFEIFGKQVGYLHSHLDNWVDIRVQPIYYSNIGYFNATRYLLASRKI